MLPRARGDELIKLAAYKLIAAEIGRFNEMNKHHVFAVLSQRLCLDIDLVSAGAAELADRSVSHHMRLFTGLSQNFILIHHRNRFWLWALHDYCTFPARPRGG